MNLGYDSSTTYSRHSLIIIVIPAYAHPIAGAQASSQSSTVWKLHTNFCIASQVVQVSLRCFPLA